MKQNTFFFKACPKKLRECLALCTQLPPAPSSSSIFLSIPSSWCFLISPQCLGIAVFLEANLSRALQMPLWVWIPERRCLSSSTTCILLVFLGKLLTLKQTRTCLLTFPSGSSHRSTWLLRQGNLCREVGCEKPGILGWIKQNPFLLSSFQHKMSLAFWQVL